MVNQYCAHSFAKNWQLPCLNQKKGGNDHRKYFMIKLPIRLGSNPQPPDNQSNPHPTEPPRPTPAKTYISLYIPVVWWVSLIFTDDDEFRFNNVSIHEGHLHQNQGSGKPENSRSGPKIRILDRFQTPQNANNSVQQVCALNSIFSPTNQFSGISDV